MKEINGNLWDYYGKPNHIICITTNGFVKTNGECVMGRGCAYEATRKIPGVAKKLGGLIRQYGNRVFELEKDRLWTFPVKHNWFEVADIELIKTSAETIKNHANHIPEVKWVIPRPGCGNGHLQWAKVKPLLEELPDNVLVITF